jgi:MarR family transcriptional regulator, organic hydroperoxide resistance regulator
VTQQRVPTVGYLVWHLSTKWRVAVDRALNPLGLTHAHYSLLASLYALSREGARPSQRELADFAGLEVMYVSKLVRPLERSKLLRRGDHPDDPRAFQLELTVQGSELIVNAANVVQKLYDQLLAPLGGRTSKRSAALVQTLGALLDHTEEFNRSRGALETKRSPRAAKKRRGEAK